MKKCKLYIDESGNTGGISVSNQQYSFRDQPYYVLAGILLVDEEKELAFKNYINSKVDAYRILAPELKAINIYGKNPWFIADIVDYIILNKIPFFIELMDKVFYLNIHLLDYFILPIDLFELDDEAILKRRHIASNIGSYIDYSIYQALIHTCISYSNESLELFYETLKKYFTSIGEMEFAECIRMTEAIYFECKKEKKEDAFKDFLPIPDKNRHNRLLHLLPNYQAFTGLVARTQKYKNTTKINSIDILHDKQEQFAEIFISAFNYMKKHNSSEYGKNTFIEELADHNIEEDFSLSFIDSKDNIFIQIADILAGFTIRFWADYIKGNNEKIDLYKPIMEKLRYPFENVGINFVVPDQDYENYCKSLS